MKAILVFILSTIIINQSLTQNSINFKSSSHLRQDSLIQYNFNSGNDSIRYYKEEYSNYQGDNWTIFVSSFWDSTNLVWVPDFRMEYNYNSFGSDISRAKFDWDIVQEEWIPRDKYTNEYDEEGRRLNSLLIKWDPARNEWINSWKQEYTIDDIENTRLQITNNWNLESSEWVPYQQTYYQYYMEDVLQSIIQSNWHEDEGEWELKRKVEYEHNSIGTVIGSLHYNWIIEDNDWKKYMKYTRNYNKLDNIQSDEYSNWDEDTDEWLVTIEYLKQFDDNGNLIMDDYYYAGESIPRQRYTFEYDNNNNLLMKYYYGIDSRTNDLSIRNYDHYIYDPDISNILRRRFYWESEIESWVIYISEISYFSKVSGIPYESISSVSIFPNPSSGIINIAGLTFPAEIEILNIEGRIMKTISHVDRAIDASDLTPGLYILKIKSGNDFIIKRIMIE